MGKARGPHAARRDEGTQMGTRVLELPLGACLVFIDLSDTFLHQFLVRLELPCVSFLKGDIDVFIREHLLSTNYVPSPQRDRKISKTLPWILNAS